MTPERQLAGFLAKYTPDIARRTRQILGVMRNRLPGALELVYDNYNALAIGFGSSERASDVRFSIVAYPRWVTLFLFQAARIPDPTKRLRGKGSMARHIVLDDASVLDAPDVRALMQHMLAARPLDPRQKHRIVIKSISKKQRPRRPPAGAGKRSRPR